MKRILSLLLAVALAAPSLAAEKPLVIQSGQIKKLPSATSLQLNAPTTANASVNLPHGTAPASPNDGDCWTTTSGLYCRISGSTVGPYGSNGSAIAADSIVGNFTGSSAVPTSQALPSCSGSNDALYYNTTTHTIGCHAPSGAGGGTVTSIATSGLVTGGTITGTGTISLSSISAGYVVGNSTGSSAVPTASTVSALIDQAIGGTQGQILYRGSSAWSALSPGTSGQVLTTGGAGANPSWAAASSGTAWDFSPPTAASFSLQSGDATNLTLADDGDVGMTVDSGTAVNSDVQRFAYRTLTTPSADWSMKVKFDFELSNSSFNIIGLLLRDNTGGKNVAMQFSSDGSGVDKAQASSMTAFVSRSSIFATYHTRPPWLRIDRVSSNFLFYVSKNGKQWRLVLTESVTNYLAAAPNRVGVFVRTGTATTAFSVSYFSLTGPAV